MSILLINSEAFHVPLADRSVHMVAFSPPYWGLRDYSVGGQLGLERSPDCLGWATGSKCGECFVCHVMQYMAEAWRVLRDDGTCWVNIGDSYAANRGYQVADSKHIDVGNNHGSKVPDGLKPKDMILIPQRLALALQSCGWYIRSDIVWHKPNPMTYSGTDRPTSDHEYVWLMSKSPRYYYDHIAIQEPAKASSIKRTKQKNFANQTGGDKDYGKTGVNPNMSIRKSLENYAKHPETRNRRSTWTIVTQPYKGSHFATWPEKLVEPMILAGTSEKGCCSSCGAQWKRILSRRKHATRDMESQRELTRKTTGRSDGHVSGPSGMTDETETAGWEAGCSCSSSIVPSRVLDIFAGSGTTLLVARRLGRSAIGCDLSFKYLRDNARERLGLNKLDDWNNGKPRVVDDTIE